MNRHPHAQAANCGPIICAYRTLCIDRSAYRVFDGNKGGAERVTDGLKDGAAVFFDRGAQYIIVPVKIHRHSIWIHLPSGRTSFDVTKKEDSLAGWRSALQLLHCEQLLVCTLRQQRCSRHALP
jgi:hypothetical protein